MSQFLGCVCVFEIFCIYLFCFFWPMVDHHWWYINTSFTCWQNRTRDYKFLTRNVFPCLVLPTVPAIRPFRHCSLMVPHFPICLHIFLFFACERLSGCDVNHCLDLLPYLRCPAEFHDMGFWDSMQVKSSSILDFFASQ